MFVGRNNLLNRLNEIAKGTSIGRIERVAIIGPRGIGKTSLVMAFLKRPILKEEGILSLYIDFEEIVSSPEEFSIQYISQILEGYLGEKTPYRRYTIEGLRKVAKLVRSSRIDGIIDELGMELERRVVDRKRIISLAFSFPIILSDLLKKRFLLFIDEFPFLQDLNNFKGIDKIFDIFGGYIEKSTNISYIITGSNTHLMKNLQRQNPYYKDFEPLWVGPLEIEEGVLLAKKTLLMEGVTTRRIFAKEIYDYAKGHPYYIHSIAKRVGRKVASGIRLSSSVIQDAVAEEVILQEGRIHLFCRYIYDLSLEMARSKSLLKAILYILAQEEALNLTEIAFLLRRTPGETSSLLQRLIEVDLITKEEGRYLFKDKILRHWLRYSRREEEFAQAKDGLINDLKEEIKRERVELVVDIERVVQILKVSFKGQRLPGQLFGRGMDVVFVEASRIREIPFKDGRGLLVEGRTSSQAITSLSIFQSWVIGIMSSRIVDSIDIEGMIEVKERIQNQEDIIIDRTWIISIAGFSEDAIRLSKEKGILLTDKDGWVELEEMLLEDGDQSSISI